MPAAQKTFLFRLAVLSLSVLLVGVAGRSAGVNEALPRKRVIEGLVLPVPRMTGGVPLALALTAGGVLLAACALAPSSGPGTGADQPRRVTSQSTR